VHANLLKVNVEIVEVAPQELLVQVNTPRKPGHFGPPQIVQSELSNERDDQPERGLLRSHLLLLLVPSGGEEHEQRGNDVVHALAVADVRYMERHGLEHVAQLPLAVASVAGKELVHRERPANVSTDLPYYTPTNTG
jgi:hypothetical protein